MELIQEAAKRQGSSVSERHHGRILAFIVVALAVTWEENLAQARTKASR